MELMMGVAIAAVLALVVSGIFKAGILTSRYSLSQTQILSEARTALIGSGRIKGMLWQVQEGSSFSTLSSTSLAVGYASAASISFRLSGKNLLQSQLGVDQKVTTGISSMTFSYYNLDSTGRIMESTDAASAALVTATLVFPGERSKSYNFFTGAALRNKP
jgi:hypothetical protein